MAKTDNVIADGANSVFWAALQAEIDNKIRDYTQQLVSVDLGAKDLRELAHIQGQLQALSWIRQFPSEVGEQVVQIESDNVLNTKLSI